MIRQRWAATVLCTVLGALPSVALPGTASAAAPRAGHTAVTGGITAAVRDASATPSAPASPSTPAIPSTAPAYQACPMATVPYKRPPDNSPAGVPAHSPAIGGQGLATTGLTVPAGAGALPKIITARSWLVADLDTGAVLGACAPHAQHAPASVQKLLLAATVMPKLDPNMVVTVVPEDMDFEAGSSAVGLVLGGKYSVSTLWLGLMLNSGNDAADVLARLGGGAQGRAGGIAAMNAEAHLLGAYDTHAVTPSGLDGPGQYTSAYDLALIARADFGNADFRRYVSTRNAEIPAQPAQHASAFQIQNDNQLLYQYPGALGGKVGYTDFARQTYVGFAERGGRRLVVTLLDGEAEPARGWKQGAALLDWGFSLPRDAAVGRLVNPGELDRPATPSHQPAPAAAAASTRHSGAIGNLAILALSVLLVASIPVGWLLLRRRHRRRAIRARAAAPRSPAPEPVPVRGATRAAADPYGRGPARPDPGRGRPAPFADRPPAWHREPAPDRPPAWDREPAPGRDTTWHREPAPDRPPAWDREPAPGRDTTWHREPARDRPPAWDREPARDRPPAWDREPAPGRPPAWHREPAPGRDTTWHREPARDRAANADRRPAEWAAGPEWTPIPEEPPRPGNGQTGEYGRWHRPRHSR